MAVQPEPVAANAQRLYEYGLALKGLDIELEELRAEFEVLWMARARRSEIHVALGYFASLRTRYRGAVKWLLEQRAALLNGEPIDADLDSYDAGDHRVLWQLRSS
jgi:hypothetical protein